MTSSALLPHQQQQARLLAGLHLFLIILTLITFGLRLLNIPLVLWPDPVEFGVVMLLLSAGYILSRSRLYLLAAALDFALGGLAALTHQADVPLMYLEQIFYLLALAYLTSIFLPPRSVIGLIILTTFLPRVLAELQPEPLVAAALSFGIPAAAFVLLIARQRRLPEAALRPEWADYQEQFHFIADNTQDIIGRIAPDGKILYINQAVERVMGYRRSDFLGHPVQQWMKFVHPDDKEQVTRQMQHPDFLTTSTMLQYRGRHADGHTVWIESVSTAVKAESGRDEIIVVSRDVTAREEAERRRHASEARLRTLFDSVSQSVVVIDLDGRIQAFNRIAAERNRQFGQREIQIGDPLEQYLADSMRPEVMRALEAALAGKTIISEQLMTAPGGEQHWYEFRSIPVMDSAGMVTAACLTGEDITERKQAEIVLRESQTFLQSTLDLMPSHIAILNAEGTIIVVNAAWREFADRNGYALPGYGVGTNYLDVCEAAYLNGLEDAQQTAEGIRRVIAGADSRFDFEYTAHSPTEQYWFMMRVVPFLEDSRARAMVVHQNVTEAKQAQESLERTLGALQISYDTLFRLIEQSPVGIQVFDTSGQCVSANSAHLEIFNVPDKDALVAQFNVLTDPLAEAAGTRQGFLRALQGEIVHQPDVRLDFSQADPRYSAQTGQRVMSVAFFPIYDQQDSIINVVAMNQDVTESRHAEEQRLELALERERVRLLRQFINDLSHDLRTPLATIGTSVYLLSKATSDDRRSHHAAVLQAQVKHMEQVLKHLLSMTYLESGKEDLTLQELNLNELLSQIVNEHEEAAETRQQRLTFEGDASSPALLADPVRLREAVANVLINAINYTPVGGDITVRILRQAKYACIEVQDNGIGMNKADQLRIFDHFYRADKARSTDTGGVGLGLTIARRIVELHRGKITVESTPGQGSTFRIWLPL